MGPRASLATLTFESSFQHVQSTQNDYLELRLTLLQVATEDPRAVQGEIGEQNRLITLFTVGAQSLCDNSSGNRGSET